MRQVVLDTETTGLDVAQGNRIIEIGCVELDRRRLTGRHYHQYINPEREVEEGALEVHGITDAYLADKPLFPQIADEFLAFVEGSELLIHNAAFDVAFLDAELGRMGNGYGRMADYCKITDTLAIARKKHPGQRSSLDALCKRYGVDNSQRDLHGALLDAEILADVYLLLTGGQTNLVLADGNESGPRDEKAHVATRIDRAGLNLKVASANPEEQAAHEKLLARIQQDSGQCVWLNTTTTTESSAQ